MHLFETRPGQQEGTHRPDMEAPEWWCGTGDARDWMTPAAFGEERGKKRIRSCWGGGGGSYHGGVGPRGLEIGFVDGTDRNWGVEIQ